MKRRLIVVAAAALFSAGCASTLDEAGPRIGEALNRKAPPPEDLTVQQSAPIEAKPELALENYREILELSPDDDTKVETMRRLADLQIEIDEVDPQTNDAALQNSIRIYEDLLREHPDAPGNDRVLYQLARAYQNAGNSEGAIQALERLQTDFPDSDYAADSHFRRGELLFGVSRFSEASEEYRQVLALGDATPFYDAAQYKLAWSQYKRTDYEGALEVCFTLLERSLPAGELSDPQAALEATDPGQRSMVKDILRVAGLSFAGLGGGAEMNRYLATKGDPRYFALLYESVGQQMLDQERYSDAAGVFAAFRERHGNHPLAPQFQAHVIDAYQRGGFTELIIPEKERYANTYDPRAPYWKGREVPAEVLTALRQHFEDLAKYYHSLASSEPDTHSGDFITAASWYRRLLEVFPQDPSTPEFSFLLAESLYAGGRTVAAAEQYLATAYDLPPHPRSAESAYAAVLAYQKNATAVPAAQRPEALRLAIDAGRRFASAHPQHPQALPVLTRSAEDLFEIKDYAAAVELASQVLQAQPAAPIALRRTALGVTADAEFTQEHYAEAERAYAELLPLTVSGDAEHQRIYGQMAASTYKQAESSREQGDLAAAVDQFLRVGQLTPDAGIRVNADYDAAAALMQLEDWPRAATVLEAFRARYPQHEFIADVDKKLAVAYERGGRSAAAAGAYQRIATRASETSDVRREASWKAAELFEEAQRPQEAAQAYELYVSQYPQPFDTAVLARQRLVALSKARGDTAGYRRWLGEIVRADASAGSGGSDALHLEAARASLEIGKMDAQSARAIPLTLPIEQKLPAKRQAMQAAIDSLSKAANYGFAEVTTAATLELGDLYRAFGRALMQSERPRGLNALELEQYELLLEEQAYPFEEKAIEWYETNLRRIRSGVYDGSVRKSYDALVEIAPGQYAKNIKAEAYYDALR